MKESYEMIEVYLDKCEESVKINERLEMMTVKDNSKLNVRFIKIKNTN